MMRQLAMAGALTVSLPALAACEGGARGDVRAPVTVPPTVDPARVTTDAEVALRNLDAQIAGLEAAVARRPHDVLLRRMAVEQLLSRAHFTGRYGDFRRAEALVAAGVAAGDPGRHRLVARFAAAVHRFDAAADALSRAAAVGDRDPTGEVTAAVATGDGLEAALSAAEAAVAAHPSFDALVALAASEAALGDFEDADAHFRDAVAALSDPTPFPIAYVAFQRGVMWGELADRPDLARPLYEEAVERLPSYPVANVHLAELEVDAGQRARALRRLDAIAASSPDPEPSGALGALLLERDPASPEGHALVDLARARYEALLRDYPEAFADHAAEFFSGPGGDPSRGLALALANLSRRRNPRAFVVTLEAASAAGDVDTLCAVAVEAQAAMLPSPSLDAALADALEGCP